MESLFEAFENLEDIDDLMLSASINDVEKIKAFKEGDDVTIEYQKIIDPLARTEDELEGNYLGKKILQCCVCHSLLYKDEKDIRFNEEETLANEGEECPMCFSTEGFKVVGEVSPLKDDTLYTEDDEQFELARDVKNILEKFYRKSNEVDFEPLFKLETNGTLELDRVREKLLEEPKAIKDELLGILDIIEKGGLTNIAEPENVREVVKRVSELIKEEPKEEVETKEETEIKEEPEESTEVEEKEEIEESLKESNERFKPVARKHQDGKYSWIVFDNEKGRATISFGIFDTRKECEEKIEEIKKEYKDVLKESTERDDIDADADDKKERIRKALKRRLDDADSLRDERRKSARAKFRKAQDDIDADRDDKLERKGLRENKKLDEGFRGCKKVRMIWHGEWSAPELYYKDEDGKEYFANYYDVEDSIWNYYQEEAEYAKKNNDKYAKELNSKYDWSSLNEKDDTDFNKFVVDNENSVIEDVIEFSESNNYDHSEEIDESCKSVKESVTPRDDIDAEADNRKELAKKRFMRAKDDADADKDYRLKKANLKEPRKLREELKESDKPAATSIEDAQKWVDYDMKKYGRISRETNRLVRRAGFQIIKDQYGDYEVTARDYERPEEESLEESNKPEKGNKIPRDATKLKLKSKLTTSAHKVGDETIIEKDEFGRWTDGEYQYPIGIIRNQNVYDVEVLERESLKEDTVKVRDGKWVNKGKEGTHGTFRTKKAADEQRKAMFARGYKAEELKESKKLCETGEWEDDEEGIAWKEDLVNLVNKYTNKEIGIEDVEGFDKYQGPTYYDGEFEYFTDNEISDSLLIHDIGTTVNAPCWYRVNSLDDFNRLKKGNLKPLKESLKNKKRVAEGFNKVNIETDDYKMDMTSDENGKVVVTTEPLKKEEFEGNAETITPLTDEESEELTKVATETPEEVEVDFDEIDEESFNEISESYMKRVYENINSFKITKATSNDTELKLEGVINFKSGKNAKTNFVFESKEMDKKNGRLKFVGENKQFAKGRKSFTLNCSVKDNKLVTESLNYNYRGKDAKTGLTKKLYGTVKK